jgi:aminoglycoside phosphotransferase (APT) family kinase protein
VPTFEPNLDLLQQAIGNEIQAFQAELIKTALGWSRVYRVTLTMSQGYSKRDSVIVKTIDPGGQLTALEAERELRFYQILHPRLPIPTPEIYYLTTDAATGFHVIVMEDLSPTHHIPVHPHQWRRDELKSVLCAYACLHTSHVEDLHYAWLAPRHESLLDFEKIPEHVAVVQRAGIWGELPGLVDLIAYARESCRKYQDEQLSLLHGDTTPTNAPIPADIQNVQPATLIDWQDVGIGMPEFDLAYLDLQPYESARLIPRLELLDLYWCYRAEIDPDIPCAEERRARQLHADVVTALWLASAAGRVTLHPFPEGTPQRMHWDSQYGIIYNRLRSLSQEIHHL